jgi:hypothetical protein
MTYIIDAILTPLESFGGSLINISTDELTFLPIIE